MTGAGPDEGAGRGRAKTPLERESERLSVGLVSLIALRRPADGSATATSRMAFERNRKEEAMPGLSLRAAAGLRRGDGSALVPPWVAPAFLVCALVLTVWSTLLFATLPRRYGADHWRLAWSGFDVGLAFALAATAISVVRRSPFGEIAAAVTGTLLVCDAWFDILTSHGASDVAQAVAEAALVELPLACLCFWIAHNFARAMETARPYLQEAGFTIRDRKLVPPLDRA
jgi:hypothetical protein